MRAGICFYALILCLVISSCKLFSPTDKSESTAQGKPRTNTSTNAPNYGNQGNNNNNNSNNNSTTRPGAGTANNNAPVAMLPEEQNMITEINLVRTDPQGYIPYVKEYMRAVRADETLSQSFKDEEIAAARELVSEMIRMRPLRPLVAHAGLYRAAMKHGEDVKQQGDLDHLGTDGSLPWDRINSIAGLREGNENLVGGGSTIRESVIILLVDSGVSGRGHRLSLLDPSWRYVACHQLGNVGGIENSWIQVFGTDGSTNSGADNYAGNNTNPGNITYRNDPSIPRSYSENSTRWNNNNRNNNSNSNRNNNNNSNNSQNNSNWNNNRNTPSGFSNNRTNSTGEFSFMSNEERAMIDEINLVRSNPRDYVRYVRQYMNDFRNAGWGAAETREEITSAEELIKELQRRLPLSQLKPDAQLHNVARNHGEDIRRMGVLKHKGSDGSNPWDRVQRNTNLSDGNENLVGGGTSVRESVIMLLVDSGIPDRGHRRTLLDPAWNYVACYKIGDVGEMPDSWVQVFGKK
ncbi:MAG: CAP domain-containing protein [Bacteroidota bacterium]